VFRQLLNIANSVPCIPLEMTPVTIEFDGLLTVIRCAFIVLRVPVMPSLVRWLSTCQCIQICHYMTLYNDRMRSLLTLYLQVALRRVFRCVVSFHMTYSLQDEVIQWVWFVVKSDQLPEHGLDAC